MSKSLVIIPTYNEEENIGRMIPTVLDLPDGFHILVVDDNSPDKTATIVKELAAQHPGRVYIEERAGKLGLGTAYIHGFKWALAHHYDFIFEMDADFSHNPKDLSRLHYACAKNGADVAVGSRYCKGGGVENWPWERRFLSYYASIYVRMVLWLSVKDTTAGFMCYSAKVLRAIDLDNIQFIGYAFQIEMKYKAIKLGYSIEEVPIIFKDRTMGESKMHKSIITEAILGVLKMRFMKIKKAA